jgi:hypothetical protein
MAKLEKPTLAIAHYVLFKHKIEPTHSIVQAMEEYAALKQLPHNASKAEIVNILIVNAIRYLDEEHRLMLIDKITQNMSEGGREKLGAIFEKNQTP